MILPKIEGYVMGRLLIKVGDANVIEGKVFSKEKAQIKYEDAVAKGDTAVLAKESKQGDIKIQIGNLLAGQEAKVEIEMISILKIEVGAYCLKIPMQFFPQTSNEFLCKYNMLIDIRPAHAL